MKPLLLALLLLLVACSPTPLFQGEFTHESGPDHRRIGFHEPLHHRPHRCRDTGAAQLAFGGRLPQIRAGTEQRRGPPGAAGADSGEPDRGLDQVTRDADPLDGGCVVGQVPVDRSGGRASEAAITTATSVLSEDSLLGIYPEGTRSPNGIMYRGKTGVARMALEAKVPVIPVAMINTYEIQPPGHILPRLYRVGVRIGRPLDFSRYEGLEDDRFVLRSVTDEIMYALMELSGQEYVDMYATRAKELIAEGSPADSSATRLS